MPHCAVSGCSNNSRKKIPGIKFHSFPKKRHYKLKWIQFCERKDFHIERGCICSIHFSEDQKQKSMMNRLLGLSPKTERALIANAVPNMNSPEQLGYVEQIKKHRGKTKCFESEKCEIKKLVSLAEEHNLAPASLPDKNSPDYFVKKYFAILSSSTTVHSSGNENSVPNLSTVSQSPSTPNKEYISQSKAKEETAHMIGQGVRNRTSSAGSKTPSKKSRTNDPKAKLTEKKSLNKSEMLQKCQRVNENSASNSDIASQSSSMLNEDVPQPRTEQGTVHKREQGIRNQTKSACSETLLKKPRIDHPIAKSREKKSPNKNETPMKFLIIMSSKATPVQTSPLTLYDFTTAPNLNNWIEISDTVREVGMSKASFVLQKTQQFQRAVFFTMLNPQPNGAGFAGVSIRPTFNLKDYSNIQLHARAQGSVSDYKIVLRHKGLNQEPHPTYEQFFTMPMNEFTTISLPLANFDPYYRGRKLNSSEAEPLDTSRISSFGFQVYGGVYHPKKQSGISALEVDWVKAS